MRKVLSVACGVSAALYSLSSAAADDAPSPSAVLEEVVVTAQKREERLMDVPISITEVSTDKLASQDLTQLQDYYSRIPGLQYNGNKTYNLSLRGITTGNATNPTVSILIDDVQFGASTYAGLGNSRFPDFDPSMLERIEVLRGPQGTLYGASSLGGLIKFVTRQPDTQNFSGRVEAGMETTDGGDMGWTTRGSVNIPIMTDVAALRVSAFKRDDPAWLDNIDPYTNAVSKNINTADTYGYHAALLVKPFDGLAVTLSALEQKRSARFNSGIQLNENASGYPIYSDPIYGGITNLSLGPTSDIGDQQLYSARVEADLPAGLHLTSITAWGKSVGTNYQDVTSVFTFLPAFYGNGRTEIVDAAETEKFSQELRLSGKIAQLDWRGGVFYTRESSNVDQTLDYTLLGNTGISAVPYAGLNPYSYKERAAFADFTYHVTPQLDLQAGVRWAKNEQVSGSSQIVDPIIPSFILGTTGTNPNLYSHDTSTTWELSPVYHFTQDLMTYFRVATGYRPGGPNTVLPNVPPAFGPDKVTDYELGLKGTTFNHTLSYDVALYDIEWKNIQLQDTDAVSQFVYTTNGGKARSRGIEAEASWKPYKGLTIDANATFTDATLTEDLAPQPGIDSLLGKSGDRLPASARFTSNLSIQQDFPIVAAVTGFVGGNWSYVGARRSNFQLFERDPTNPDLNDATPRFTEPGYSLVDFQTGTEWDGWRATIFLRNAFNKLGVVTADNRNGTSVTTASFLQPRTVGFTISKDF